MTPAKDPLDALLAMLPEVRLAETEQEREAIFAFRYQVYIEEQGRTLSTDAGVGRMYDEEDDKPYTTLLYATDEHGIAGTTRLRQWEPGQIPADDFRLLSLERFKGIEQLRVGELGRLALRADQRGGMTLAALALALLNAGKTDRHLDLVFGYGAVGLAPHYDRLGWRRYAGRMVPIPGGLAFPVVLVVSDLEHHRACGTYFAPIAERAGLEQCDTAPFAGLFDERNLPVQFDKTLVRAAIDSGVASGAGFLAAMSTDSVEALAEKGFVVQVPAGELLTSVGLGERELFVIIDGEFEAFTDERVLRRMGPGEVLGEVAFFNSDGRRTASIRSVQDGRVLALRRKAVDELRASTPAVAAEILFHLARTLADRTGRSHMASSSTT